MILRALLSANLELFDCALVELSGLPQARVSALLHDRGGASLNALLTRAGLPPSTFPAFRAALEASHEVGFVGTVDEAVRLRRTLVERVLTRCETDEEAAEPLLTLLRRFAAESAREEARALGDEPLAVEAPAENGLIERVASGPKQASSAARVGSEVAIRPSKAAAGLGLREDTSISMKLVQIARFK